MHSTSQWTSQEQTARMAECQQDTVRAAVEKEMRTVENQANWRCRAVTVDHSTQSRIRIACRNEDEHQLVKRAAEKIGSGSRVPQRLVLHLIPHVAINKRFLASW